MFEQVQAEFEEAQVTAVRTVDDFDPIISLGNDAQVDNPDVGQASCNHQPSQTRWLRDVALMQVETAAFLIREQGFNAEPLFIPIAGLLRQFHVGNQVSIQQVLQGLRGVPFGDLELPGAN